MPSQPEPMPPSSSDPDASRYEPPGDSTPVVPADPDNTRYGSQGDKPPLGPDFSGNRKLPRRFGDYELLREIARGGMGVVYEAKQLKAGGRRVALKMILGGEHASAEVFERFRREANLVAGIDHPGIVPVFEVGEGDGQPFFSMALVEGGSLQQLLQAGGPLEPRAAARLVQQVAEAVQHAHDKGIIHRDIKPHNILLASWGRCVTPESASPSGGLRPPLAESTPRLTDFGLARTREGGHTVTGDQLGTPSYMAPEQAAGRVREIGPTTDVYSLGAVLYCVLTGRPPFQSSSPMETMRQVLTQEPVSPRQLNPSVPRDLETVCLKCLDKEQSRRYGSARELADELGRFLAGSPVRARPVGSWERAWRWSRRNRLVASLLLLVVVLLSVGAGAAAYSAALARQKERVEEVLAEVGQARDTAEGERKRADAEAREARKQKTAADAASTEAERQKQRAEKLRYFNQIQFTQREWDNGQVARARELLETTPRKFAGWEYDYLNTLINDFQRTLLGHTGAVTSVCFSPDGRRLASASADTIVKVWDAATGQQALSLRGHTRAVTSVCFSPDGRRLASGSWDQTVKVWDAQTGQEQLSLKGHTGWVTSVAFSPDGKRLASGSQDSTQNFKPGEVKVWDAHSGQQQLSLKGQARDVTSVCFSPDGTHLASGGKNLPGNKSAEVKVWNAVTGQETLSLQGHTHGVSSVCFSPDGRRLASASWDKTVKVWDPTTGQELLSCQGHTHWVESVCFSGDGQRLASAGVDGTVKVWDAHTGQQALSLQGHAGPVTSVVFSPDGRCIASGSRDKTVKVWDATTGQPSFSLKGHTSSVRSVCFSLDGQRIASAGGHYQHGEVKVWDAATGQQQLTLQGHTGSVESVCFSPDGKRLASASEDKTVRLWDTRTGQEVFSLKGHTGKVSSVCFSPDGRRLASAGDKTVKVWDAATGRQQLSLKGHTNWVRSVCFSPDGKRIAAGSQYGTVKVWDALSGQESLSFRVDTGDIFSLCFSPDGKRLASGDSERTVKVWDAHTGQETLSLQGHTSFVESVCFSPDGRSIASGSMDKTVKVWDARTGQEALTLNGHTDVVSSVCFSPDGKQIASGSWDRTVKLWDAPTDQHARTLKGHTRDVTTVSFSPDRKRLVSASADGTLKVWDAQTGQQTLSFQGHTSGVSSMCFSPDGKQVALASWDKTVKVWDAQTGQELLTLKGHTGTVTSVCFSPDGKQVASGSRRTDRKTRKGSGEVSGEVKVWDVVTGKDLLTLQGHTRSVRSVVFSADGRCFASGGDDGMVKVWVAQNGQDLLTLKGHTRPVTSVCFDADGKRLISTDATGDRIVWDLPSGKSLSGVQESDRLKRQGSPDAPLFAHLDGSVIRLIDHAKKEGRPRLRRLARPEPSWHDHQAHDSEAKLEWFSAAFHLDRLLRLRPWDAAVHVRRARALTRLGHRDAAALAYLTAVTLSPHGHLWPLDPGAARRGDEAAKAEKWSQAVEHLHLATHQPDASAQAWQQSLLLAQGAAGQEEACRQSCREMLDRFEAARDPKLAWNVVIASQTVLCSADDAGRIRRLVERLVGGQRNAAHLDCLGVALYRTGRFEDAARVLEEAVKAQGKGGYLSSWIFLAMTRQRLGQDQEARRRLAKVEESLTKQKFDAWQEKIYWRLLLREARALIQKMPPVPNDR